MIKLKKEVFHSYLIDCNYAKQDQLSSAKGGADGISNKKRTKKKFPS